MHCVAPMTAKAVLEFVDHFGAGSHETGKGLRQSIQLTRCVRRIWRSSIPGCESVLTIHGPAIMRNYIQAITRWQTGG